MLLLPRNFFRGRFPWPSFFPSIGMSISFCSADALRDFLPFAGGAGYALFERVHEVHDVLDARTWFGGDELAVALSIDELHQASS